MKIASVADIKTHFSAYLKTSEEGPVVVTRNGKPVAVLIGIQDEDEIERLLMAYSRRLRAILEKSRRQISEGRGIGHEKFWTDLAAPTPSKSSTKRKAPRHP